MKRNRFGIRSNFATPVHLCNAYGPCCFPCACRPDCPIRTFIFTRWTKYDCISEDAIASTRELGSDELAQAEAGLEAAGFPENVDNPEYQATLESIGRLALGSGFAGRGPRRGGENPSR